MSLKKDDEPNMFDQANQAANSQMPAAAAPFVMGSAPGTTPGTSQEAEIPMSLDVNALIHGFSGVDQGSAQSCVNPYLSAVSSASAMNPASLGADYLAQAQQANGVDNGMGSPNIQGDVNSFPNQFQSGYQMHQPAPMMTDPASMMPPPGSMMTDSAAMMTQPMPMMTDPALMMTQPAPMMTDPAAMMTQPVPMVTDPAAMMTQPAPMMIAPAAMMTQPGFVPNGLQAITPYTNQKAAKKKGVKATAYDIMLDFSTNVPMFAHKQEVYIYNAASGAYEKRTQNEVERIIMARYRDFIREYGNGTLIEKVYKLLLKEPQIVRNEVPVSDPTKIAFANCTLDLQTGCTGPHSPAYVVTFALNCDLARASHQSEECPAFDKFLYDITGGDELLIQRIWEFVGYCLTQDTNAKVYFVLQGVPDSGKSLLCNLVMDYFPEDKVSSLNVHSLKEHFALDNLESVALCVSPDLPASALDPKSASSIKQLTGNDRVSAAVKYKRNTQFRFEGKLILATNYPLLTQEPDDAFMQRAVVIPFFHSIPKEKQDGSLLDQLKAEKPAIASKALEAYIRLRKNHYKFSGDYAINSSLMFPDDLFGSSDITPFVYNFLKNFYEKDPNGMVAISSAYELFSQWVPNQFTEKMFSSAFQRFSEELYGAEHTRSYHNGEFRNARSSMKGIRLKAYSYPNV